jgi:hypothetical protein
MHEMHPLQHVVKQMMEERQREAARDAMWRRHSKAGLLKRFLDRMAGRVDPTGRAGGGAS